jgi:hypothetical protein
MNSNEKTGGFYPKTKKCMPVPIIYTSFGDINTTLKLAERDQKVQKCMPVPGLVFEAASQMLG